MLRLESITHEYVGPSGPVRALQDIDLSVGRGEIQGIIGRSGAGKSSLVRVINLLNRPTQGRVILGGVDLTTLSQPELREARRGIGMVFQHFNLLSSRTVFGNVALALELAGVAPSEIRQRVDALLDLVGLTALRDRYPAQISGGQKQRVGIARALANRPRLLLCDEATSALDPETTRSILALLQQIQREFGLTVVLITHQMQVIKQIADRVAVLDAGAIVEEGAVLDIFTAPVHATTRSLLEDIVPQRLPEAVLARIRALMASPGEQDAQQGSRLLRLAFAGDRSDQPILSDTARRFGLDLSIMHGQVDEVQGRPFGSLAVLARGAREPLEAAVTHLRTLGVQVQELSHA